MKTKKDIVIWSFVGVVVFLVLLYKFNFLNFNNLFDKTIIVNQTKKVVITQEDVFVNNILKNFDSLVVVKTYKDNIFLGYSFGVVLDSNGLLVARYEPFISNPNKIIVEYNQNTYPAKLVKEDVKSGLVFLSSKEMEGLPQLKFASPTKDDLLLAKRVVIIGLTEPSKNKFVNVGFIKEINGDFVKTTITEEIKRSTGVPVFNINGELMGIGFSDAKGNISYVRIDKIQTLAF